MSMVYGLMSLSRIPHPASRLLQIDKARDKARDKEVYGLMSMV